MNRYLAALLWTLVPAELGGEVVEKQRVLDSEAVNVLRLLYIRDSFKRRLQAEMSHAVATKLNASGAAPYKGPAYDFHSLRWEKLEHGRWRRVASIRARQFGTSAKCWVSEIHALNPEDETVVEPNRTWVHAREWIASLERHVPKSL
jgi:hypothetical protein